MVCFEQMFLQHLHVFYKLDNCSRTCSGRLVIDFVTALESYNSNIMRSNMLLCVLFARRVASAAHGLLVNEPSHNTLIILAQYTHPVLPRLKFKYIHM